MGIASNAMRWYTRYFDVLMVIYQNLQKISRINMIKIHAIMLYIIILSACASLHNKEKIYPEVFINGATKKEVLNIIESYDGKHPLDSKVVYLELVRREDSKIIFKIEKAAPVKIFTYLAFGLGASLQSAFYEFEVIEEKGGVRVLAKYYLVNNVGSYFEQVYDQSHLAIEGLTKILYAIKRDVFNKTRTSK